MFQNYYFGFVHGIAKRGDIMPQAWTLAATFGRLRQYLRGRLRQHLAFRVFKFIVSAHVPKLLFWFCSWNSKKG
jgi:hypothetical protein